MSPSERSQHFKATYRNTTLLATLLRGVASQSWLRHVGCCWLKFENGQIFHATFMDICGMMLWSFGQVCQKMLHPGMRTSSIFNTQHVTTRCNRVAIKTHARCCAQQCCDMLSWNIAIVWPELAYAGPTILGYVELIYCDRLARALERDKQTEEKSSLKLTGLKTN